MFPSVVEHKRASKATRILLFYKNLVTVFCLFVSTSTTESILSMSTTSFVLLKILIVFHLSIPSNNLSTRKIKQLALSTHFLLPDVFILAFKGACTRTHYCGFIFLRLSKIRRSTLNIATRRIRSRPFMLFMFQIIGTCWLTKPQTNYIDKCRCEEEANSS